MNNSAFPLGTNLNGIANFSPQYPFVDYFKSSRDWSANGKENQVEFDQDGWVKSLKGGASVTTLFPNNNLGEQFVVSYEGQGTIKYGSGATKIESASKPGRDVIRVEPNANAQLSITATDPKGTGDYIRDIQIVPKQYENIAQSQTFNPDFLESLEGYKVLRFMDWMGTNGSEAGKWNERVEPDDANYVGEGVPVEIMVELANETGIDPWFTMPHLATDEYVRNFAQSVKDNLDPKLEVYVEFSNEVWNNSFQQTQYARQQGEKEFPKSKSPDRAWFGKRTSEVTQIWDDVFGAGQDRVIGVLGAKATNTTTATSSLDAIKSAGLSYEEAGIDAIAIAPYFGLPLAEQQNIAAIEGWTKKGTQFALDQLFKEITQGGVLPKGDKGGSIHKAGELISDYVDLAEKEGLDLVAYEGGQHIAPRHNGMENNKAIVDLFVAANRDPRMGAVYNQYFEQWDDLTGDGLFAHFSDVSPYGKWGSWGARESLYQKSSPKYDVIQDWLTNSQGSSPPTSTPNPTPNPTPTPTPEPPKNSEVFAGKPIIGVNQNKPNPGAGEKDTLIGNSNANLFVLGNSETAFYDDNASNLGKSWAGRATLKNFTLGEDRIQLHGSAEDYSLKTINGSTRIFETSGPVNEVIGLVPGGVTLDLNNSSQFIFV